MVRAAVMVGQLVLGYLLGFVVPYALSIGNGVEDIVIPFGMAVGVWGADWLVMLVQKKSSPKVWLRLIVTIIGSGIGYMVLLALPSPGFVGLLLPLIGALVGFYIIRDVKSN